MSIAFATDGLNERDRIPYWVDVASKAFYGHGFNAEPATFSARLNCRPLHQLMIAELDCGPCSVTRTARNVRQDRIDDVIVSVRLEGRSILSQGGDEAVVGAG